MTPTSVAAGVAFPLPEGQAEARFRRAAEGAHLHPLESAEGEQLHWLTAAARPGHSGHADPFDLEGLQAEEVGVAELHLRPLARGLEGATPIRKSGRLR